MGSNFTYYSYYIGRGPRGIGDQKLTIAGTIGVMRIQIRECSRQLDIVNSRNNNIFALLRGKVDTKPSMFQVLMQVIR